MPGARFVHLNAHSAFSLLEGALPIERLLDLAEADGMPALGISDTLNLFGALEFSEKAVKRGIQPIVGCKLPVRFDATQSFGASGPEGLSDIAPITLVAATEEGYANLVRLVSSAYMDADEHAQQLHVHIDEFRARSGGVIALTGGHDGPLHAALGAGDHAKAEQRLDALNDCFDGRLYVGVERHGLAIEDRVEFDLLDLAYSRDLPLVATNEPFFASEGDYEAHDTLLAIAGGVPVSVVERRQLSARHGFSTQAEMTERYKDLAEALDATLEIAERCSHRPVTRAPILPRFTKSDASTEDNTEAVELRRQAAEGLRRRLEARGLAPGVDQEAYRKRLDYELDVIERMEFPGYFLIVADFIQWARGQDIPVGPGRGSGAGSLVAYALTITDLDPMRFSLLFERFLNPERISMPDFDIDFCQERRDEVIRYVRERYGHDQVAQIITFGTLQARAVVRDVGRALEMPYGQVDQLAKLVPSNPANPVKLAEAIEGEPRLQNARDEDEGVARLLETSLKLEGLYRHASTHAAGIVIGDRPLDQLVPLYRDPRSDLPVTQFNMKWVEPAGLVKFDFLGLKTLTVLEKAAALVRDGGAEIDVENLPLDCEKTYAMLARGETVGVFQLESAGMRRALVGMKADRFEDLIALVALYRPGPMDNIPTYNRRKQGLEQPEYLHEKLEPILRETHGVIIYQEQVMQIAQTLSGYSLGEADLLRRAMGKKIRAEMDAQRSRFIDGAVERGLKAADAKAIFDLVAKFASYGFNKSHAAAYALIAYQTAYLKAHFPVEFLAASMTLDMGNTDKLNDFRQEARRLNVEIVPPCVNRCGASFGVEDGRILYALSALKGVGQGAVEHIVATRGEKPFKSFADFAARIDPRLVNKRTLECLAAAGGFDSLSTDRPRVFGGAGRILAAAQERHNRDEAGVIDLFGEQQSREELALPPAHAWTVLDRLQREFGAIGFYLGAHPLDEYRKILEPRGVEYWTAFERAVRGENKRAGILAGTVVQRQERRTRTGSKIGIFRFSDPSSQYEAVAYAEQLSGWRDLLEPGESVIVTVSADYDAENEDVRVRIQGVEPLEEAAAAGSRNLRVFLDKPEPLNSLGKRLTESGKGEVVLVLMSDKGREVEVRLPGRYRLTPQIAGAVKAIEGVRHIEMA